MYSSLIGMVEKSHRYAQEKDRVKFSHLSASIRGENDSHQVSFDDGKWYCSCQHFNGGSICSHTMAIERILDGMVSQASAR